MTERIEKLVSLIPKSKVFADIGCDHGYVAKGVLESGKADSVIISDISERCLKKAETLLKDYVNDGKVLSFVSDGFHNLPLFDTALIAGMGGEEIIKIISSSKFLPYNLILQPMKNVDKVRETVVRLGYKITFDCVYFLDQKYYDFIILKKGNDSLTEDEILFGRTNIKERGTAFLDRLRIQKKFAEELLKKELPMKEREKKEYFIKKVSKYV